MLVFLGNLFHNLVKSVRFDGFDSFLLVDVVHRDTLVLEREEEEHHLVDLLCVPLLLLSLLPQLQPELLLLDEKIYHTLWKGLDFPSFLELQVWHLLL